MFLIDKNGKRPICRECAAKRRSALHKVENCPLEKKRRKRERQGRERWLAQMIGLRDAIAAERAAKQA